MAEGLLLLRLPDPPAPQRAASHARRRFASAFQQFFQYYRVVVLFVARRIEQRDLLARLRQSIQFFQRRAGLGRDKFLEIPFPEESPSLRIGMEPLAQLGRRR